MLPLRWQSCMFNRRTLLVRVGVIRMRCTGKECIDIYNSTGSRIVAAMAAIRSF